MSLEGKALATVAAKVGRGHGVNSVVVILETKLVYDAAVTNRLYVTEGILLMVGSEVAGGIGAVVV